MKSKLLDKLFRKPAEHTVNHSKRKQMSTLLKETNHAIKYLKAQHTKRHSCSTAAVKVIYDKDKVQPWK